MRMGRNGRREAHRNLSFHFTRWSARRTGEREPFISISHALIYISPIYLYLHTPLFCSERQKDNSAKHVLVEAWLQLFFFLSLPFMVSAKHSGLKWGEKSDDPPLSFKSNQVNEDVGFFRNDRINEGLVYVCYCGLNYFLEFDLCSVGSHLFLSLFLSRKGLSST